jgi:hypothetical protein
VVVLENTNKKLICGLKFMEKTNTEEINLISGNSIEFQSNEKAVL